MVEFSHLAPGRPLCNRSREVAVAPLSRRAGPPIMQVWASMPDMISASGILLSLPRAFLISAWCQSYALSDRPLSHRRTIRRYRTFVLRPRPSDLPTRSIHLSTSAKSTRFSIHAIYLIPPVKAMLQAVDRFSPDRPTFVSTVVYRCNPSQSSPVAEATTTTASPLGVSAWRVAGS